MLVIYLEDSVLKDSLVYICVLFDWYAHNTNKMSRGCLYEVSVVDFE